MATPLATPMCFAQATQYEIESFKVDFSGGGFTAELVVRHLDTSGAQVKRQVLNLADADTNGTLTALHGRLVTYLRNQGVIN